MEIILIIVVVLFIAAIAALLFIKKRQSSLDDTPVIPNIAQQKPDEERSASALQPQSTTLQQPTQQPAPTTDALAIVDLLLNEQRYDDAIAQLKRHLMANPKNTQAMLKLLQVYGITNNQNAFNQLHQKIHEIGDDETIEQADFCRSLLEDDFVASSTAATTTKAAAEINDIDSLDFDIGNTQTAALDSSHQNTVPELVQLDPIDEASDDINTLDDINSLEDAFDLSFDEPEQANTVDAQTTKLDDSLDVLEDEFDLDDLDLNIGSTPTTNNDSLDASLDNELFDLSFDEPKTEPTQAQSDDDFSLDGDLDLDTDLSLDDSLSLDSSSIPDNKNTANNLGDNTASELSLDGDFNFDDSLGLESVSLDNSTETHLDSSNDLKADDALDFDDILADNIIQPVSDTSLQPKNDLTSDFGSFDLDGSSDNDSKDSLDFDDLSLAEKPSLATQPNPAASPALVADELDFSLDINPTADLSTDEPSETLDFELSVDSQSANKSDDLTFGNDDALSFDLKSDTTPAKATTLQAEDLDLGLDLGADLSDLDTDTAVSSQAPMTAPTVLSPAPQVNDLSHDLSFTQDLSGTQVTLLLAEQYLSLGEHDSAKRLLEEVVNSSQGAEQQKAQDLLNHLG